VFAVLREPPGRRTPRGRRLWLRAFAGLLLCVAECSLAASPTEMLTRADQIRLTDHAGFMRLTQELDGRMSELSPVERQYLDYLHGWTNTYDGDYDAAIKRLSALLDSVKDPMLKFRAGATLVNALALHKRYKEAYSKLDAVLALLPQVTDGGARQQGMLIAAYLYNEIGQYRLGLRLAQSIIDENWTGTGVCRGGQVKLQALYRSGKLQEAGPELQAGIDACAKTGDVLFENAMPLDLAKIYVQRRQYDEAVALLTAHYDAVIRTRYRRMISEYDASLAQAYRGKSASPMARKLALEAIQNTDANQYTEPLADAYSVLYELAKDQGDFKSALAFHEQYAVANRGYLDDDRARHLAFQSVSRESSANQLQVEARSEQNLESQLQRELDAKASETIRLYVTLLVLVSVFAGFWVYRARRSNLQLTSTSQFDR
jgi:tetratricopeptide (TPR) repeat protein